MHRGIVVGLIVALFLANFPWKFKIHTMDDFFAFVFAILVIICIFVRLLLLRSSANTNSSRIPDNFKANDDKKSQFKRFQWLFLIVYFIMMGADWLQGPYVYALYESYGFGKNEIGILFIGGFFSSLVFGTFVGGLADKFGRKRLCMVFGVLYSLSCLTKLVNDFNILLVGRILSGISTSLLFSSFESWMVTEHKTRGFPSELLSETFSLATFGNGIIAIAAGLIASVAANLYGYVSPFMVSLAFLIVGTAVVMCTWNENYGDERVEVLKTFTNAVAAMKEDTKIPLLGLVQSLFEAAMYTFVFMWTPVLQKSADAPSTLPFGLIFACFMVCVMIGSSLFGYLVDSCHWRPHSIAKILLFLACISLAVPIYATDMTLVLISFLVFEVCCGLYFPCLGTLRGIYIPEDTRAAVMNFFRVPLNALVVLVLIKVGDLENTTVFIICSLWLAVAFFVQILFTAAADFDKGQKVGE